MHELELSFSQRSQRKEKRRLDLHHQLAALNSSLADYNASATYSTSSPAADARMEFNNITLRNTFQTESNKWIFELANTTE